MIPDPTEEIKSVRRKLAAEFDNDVRRIGADIRRQQRESGRTYITLPRREPVIPRVVDSKSSQESGEAPVPETDTRD